MRTLHGRLFPLIAVSSLMAAACSSGESLPLAGNDPDVTSGTTVTPDGGTDATTPDGGEPPATSPDGSVAPVTSAAPTTTTTPLDTLPACPVDALGGADGVVDVTFWHGLNTANETSRTRVVTARRSTSSSSRAIRVVPRS